MKVSRRGFLGLLGGAAAAVAVAPKPVLALPPSAPLFVPSDRLAFGVPTQRLVTAVEAKAADVQQLWDQQQAQYQATSDRVIGLRNIPMLLVQSEYLAKYGGKLPAGSEVMVDRTTAERWVKNGIATPGLSAPRDLQERSAQRRLEREAERVKQEWHASFLIAEDIGARVPIAERLLNDQDYDLGQTGVPRSREEQARRSAALDAGWQRLVACARAAGFEAG